MIKLADRSTCTGCNACVNSCKFGAIEKRTDEYGFIYPYIDNSKCKNCTRCVKSCPVLEKQKEEEEPYVAFLMQSKRIDYLEKSASGGFISEYIEHNMNNKLDAVVGAAFDSNFNVVHTLCTSREESSILQGSKYVQSDIGDTYSKTEEYLKDGRKVCFIGTPCQIAGLYGYLGKTYDSLFTIDFLCHSVPSPKAWQIYLKRQEKKFGSSIDVHFKDKKYGYTFPTLSIKTTKHGKEKIYYFTSQADGFMSAFLQGRISRECCENCKFRNIHYSDITVADYYQYSKLTSEFKSNMGVNRVVTWNKKGMQMVESIKDKVISVEVDPSSIFVKSDFGNTHHYSGKKDNVNDTEKILENRLKVDIKSRIVSVIRIILYKIGLQDFVKRIVKG